LNIGKLFSKAGLGILGESGTKVIFRSNVTPDIVVDISELMKVKAVGISIDDDAPVDPTPETEEVPISSEDTRLLKIIRPEVSLNILGNRVSHAPYGRPRRTTAVIFVFALIASSLIGAKLAWVACKKI